MMLGGIVGAAYDIGPGLPQIWRGHKSLKSFIFGNCFPAGTPVSTERGLRPIEEVLAGERVWAFDHAANDWTLCRVAETYENDHDGELVAVSVAGEVVESTGHHPWWVARGEGLSARPYPEHVPDNPEGYTGTGRWVDAIDLRAGDVLLLRSGEEALVTSLVVRQARVAVYNFQVEGLHCYAVGRAGALVHNNSAEVASTAAKGFANLECEPCAKAVEAALKKAGHSGELIELKGADFIISSSRPAGSGAISINGRHLGVRVGDMVYDNITPHGIPFEQWLASFDSRRGIIIRSITPFGPP